MGTLYRDKKGNYSTNSLLGSPVWPTSERPDLFNSAPSSVRVGGTEYRRNDALSLFSSHDVYESQNPAPSSSYSSTSPVSSSSSYDYGDSSSSTGGDEVLGCLVGFAALILFNIVLGIIIDPVGAVKLLKEMYVGWMIIMLWADIQYICVVGICLLACHIYKAILQHSTSHGTSS